MKKTFYYINTTRTLPVSTTGQYCALNCKHCNKHYLKHMKTFNDIFNKNIYISDYTSYLISGGSNLKGHVPFFKQLDNILKLKQLGKKINLHTGLLSPEYFEYLYIADSISIDMVGDDKTINYVYNLNKKSIDYFKYFEKLVEFKIKNNFSFKIVPHITIGLYEGHYSGEKNTLIFLEKFKDFKPSVLETIVFLILIPTKGTPFENIKPPETSFVKEIFISGFELFKESKTNLFLGCMRPKGKYRENIDLIAIHSGINGIVNPTFKFNLLKKFKNKFLKIEYQEECCALI